MSGRVGLPRPRRAAEAAVLALIAAFCALVWVAGSGKSETIDEDLFIGGGVAQVAHGNPNFDLTHPPLLRWLAGIPAVVFGGARCPEPVPFHPYGEMPLNGFKNQDQYDFGWRVFYDPGEAYHRILFFGRLPFALLSALLAWLLFRRARTLYGEGVAVAVAAVFLFIPEVLAQSQWAHSDAASALTIFLVAGALARGLEEPSERGDALLGLALGLAVAVKFTALLLWPLAAVLAAARLARQPKRWLQTMLVSGGVGLAVVVLSYLPQPRLWPPHAFSAGDLAVLPLGGVSRLLGSLPLPDTLLKGLVYTYILGKFGTLTYLHGRVIVGGVWYYFPVALFLKYPTGLLVAAGAGLYFFLRGPGSRIAKACYTLPPAVILAAAMSQKEDVGVRSVLPLAPFFALWCGAALSVRRKRWQRAGAAALLATSVGSGLLAFPNFLAYFNPLLGGTRAAGRWLADSNLDWGQDLPALARELSRRGIGAVHLAYFGSGNPDAYGIRRLDPLVYEPGWYAISRTYLSGLWPADDHYAWLRALEPVALPGGSIALFDVTPAQARAAQAVPARVAEGLDALYRQRRPDLAATIFAEVLRVNPGYYGAWYQEASALEAQGLRAQALPYWRHMLALAERAEDAETIRACREKLGLPVPAAAATPGAEGAAGQEGRLMKMGLALLYQQHAPLQAAGVFQEVLRLDPSHYGATYQCAAALEAAGHHAEALPYWRRMEQMAEDAHDSATLALVRPHLSK